MTRDSQHLLDSEIHMVGQGLIMSGLIVPVQVIIYRKAT